MITKSANKSLLMQYHLKLNAEKRIRLVVNLPGQLRKKTKLRLNIAKVNINNTNSEAILKSTEKKRRPRPPLCNIYLTITLTWHNP